MGYNGEIYGFPFIVAKIRAQKVHLGFNYSPQLSKTLKVKQGSIFSSKNERTDKIETYTRVNRRSGTGR